MKNAVRGRSVGRDVSVSGVESGSPLRRRAVAAGASYADKMGTSGVLTDARPSVWRGEGLGCRAYPRAWRARVRAASSAAAASEGRGSGAGEPEESALRRNAGVACVMLAVFLHLLGFTVTGPITPGLVSHFGLHPSEVGYLTSAYPLGMFFALFAWPRLSDKVGRKPILVLSLLGVGCGLVAQAHCVARDWSLATFLLLRVASGAFAGASPVVKAYLADAATPEQLPAFMAWREAACTLAFIIGPTLGGLLFSGSSLSACISVTGWASIAAATLVAVIVREVRDPSADEGEGFQAGDGLGGTRAAEPRDDVGLGSSGAATKAATAGAEEEKTALACPLGKGLVAAVATICVTSFLYNAGQSTFDSFFPVFSTEVLGMGPRAIGTALTSLAAVSFIISATGFARVQKSIGLTMTTALGLILVASGLTLIGFATSPELAFAAAVLYVSGIPLFTPAVPILLMQCVPPKKRGAVMGLDSAVNSAARIMTPILLGKVYYTDPTRCFAAGAAAVALAAAVVIARRIMVLGGVEGSLEEVMTSLRRKAAAD